MAKTGKRVGDGRKGEPSCGLGLGGPEERRIGRGKNCTESGHSRGKVSHGVGSCRKQHMMQKKNKIHGTREGGVYGADFATHTK
jgi:hypothetical protein